MTTTAHHQLPPRPYIASEDGSMQIAFSPDLAAALGGIGQSIFLRQLAYWIRNDEIDFYNPHIIFKDGLWWICQSSERMAARLKNCIKARTIRDYIKEFEQAKILVTTTEWNITALDRTAWLALVPETLSMLPGITYVIPSIGEIRQSIGEIRQSEQLETNRLDTPESDSPPIGEIRQSYLYIQESEEASPSLVQEGEAAPQASPPPETVSDLVLGAFDYVGLKTTIALVTRTDVNLKKGMLNKWAKQFREAGYTAQDVLTAEEYWYKEDWRGKKGDIPRIDELVEVLPRAKEWREGLHDAGSNAYDPWEGTKGDYSSYYGGVSNE